MNPNEIIIYGFRLGNAHPEFKEFIQSLNNNEIHNLRKIMYEHKLDRYRDGYGRAIYGLDQYGCVNIPTTIRNEKWEEAGNDIYTYLKELWVSVKLGYDGKGFNPLKTIQWKYWRALVVTSNEEAKEMIYDTSIEVGLQYLFSIGFVKSGTTFTRYITRKMSKPIPFPEIRGGYGVFGKKGLNIKGVKIEALYRDRNTGGTLISIKQSKKEGSLFRIDYGSHDTYFDYWHIHRRFYINGKKYGSSKPWPKK